MTYRPTAGALHFYFFTLNLELLPGPKLMQIFVVQ